MQPPQHVCSACCSDFFLVHNTHSPLSALQLLTENENGNGNYAMLDITFPISRHKKWSRKRCIYFLGSGNKMSTAREAYSSIQF